MAMAPCVVSIQLCPGHREPMRPVRAAVLQAGVGIDGDKHASTASKRQVLLADKEALDALDLTPGTIKENITVADLEVMTLAPGTRLRLGKTATLEIISVCEPCFRMDEIRQGLRGELEGRRGMMSVVVTGGRIEVGDPIAVLEQEELVS